MGLLGAIDEKEGLSDFRDGADLFRDSEISMDRGNKVLKAFRTRQETYRQASSPEDKRNEFEKMIKEIKSKRFISRKKQAKWEDLIDGLKRYLERANNLSGEEIERVCNNGVAYARGAFAEIVSKPLAKQRIFKKDRFKHVNAMLDHGLIHIPAVDEGQTKSADELNPDKLSELCDHVMITGVMPSGIIVTRDHLRDILLSKSVLRADWLRRNMPKIINSSLTQAIVVAG